MASRWRSARRWPARSARPPWGCRRTTRPRSRTSPAPGPRTSPRPTPAAAAAVHAQTLFIYFLVCKGYLCVTLSPAAAAVRARTFQFIHTYVCFARGVVRHSVSHCRQATPGKPLAAHLLLADYGRASGVCRHLRDNVRAAGRRCGGAEHGGLGRAVLHRVQGLAHVQHLELLLLRPRLRQPAQGHLPAQEPDQPLLPEACPSPLVASRSGCPVWKQSPRAPARSRARPTPFTRGARRSCQAVADSLCLANP